MSEVGLVKRSGRRLAAPLLATCIFGLIFAAAALAVTGDLTQKPGTAGCISETGTAGACTDGKALDGALSVTVSPDGASAYAASQFSDAVAVFDRNTTTGALTQKPGTAACISETGTGGACTDGVALAAASSVTVSPDGTSAYVASVSDDAVAVFDRDVPPQTTITSGPEGLTNDRTPSFAFSSSELGSSFECRVDGGPFESCSSPFTTPFSLSDGQRRFSVRATDTTDNTDETPAERNFTVDTALDGSASAKKTQKQKGKKIVVKAKVKAKEDLEATGKGKIKVGKKSYKLKKSSKSVSSGKSKTLKLKPKKSKDSKKIVKALKKGKKAKAKLKVTLSDELGNTKTNKLSVKLKG